MEFYNTIASHIRTLFQVRAREVAGEDVSATKSLSLWVFQHIYLWVFQHIPFVLAFLNSQQLFCQSGQFIALQWGFIYQILRLLRLIFFSLSYVILIPSLVLASPYIYMYFLLNSIIPFRLKNESCLFLMVNIVCFWWS